MNERDTQRSEAAKLVGQVADELNISGPPAAINWTRILELFNKILPIILIFLSEDHTQG